MIQDVLIVNFSIRVAIISTSTPSWCSFLVGIVWHLPLSKKDFRSPFLLAIKMLWEKLGYNIMWLSYWNNWITHGSWAWLLQTWKWRCGCGAVAECVLCLSWINKDAMYNWIRRSFSIRPKVLKKWSMWLHVPIHVNDENLTPLLPDSITTPIASQVGFPCPCVAWLLKFNKSI